MLIKTPAKLNLFLHVIGRRIDGYHNLQSIFVPLKLYDQIKIEPNNIIAVETLHYNILHNTAYKAAKLLQNYAKIDNGVKITITKNIPISGGLGGSSTDAAAVLNALNQFWNLNYSYEILKSIAIEIGADVAYFLNPVCAFVEGIGEVITPITLKQNLHILIINPNIKISSSDVYKGVIEAYSEVINNDSKILIDCIWNGKNDLESTAVRMNCEIKNLINKIQLSNGCKVARMSGSGSTCFGIYDNEVDALKAQKSFSNEYFTYYEYLRI